MGCNGCKCVKKQESGSEVQFPALLDSKKTDNISGLALADEPEILKTSPITNQNTEFVPTPKEIEIQNETESISSNCLSVNQERSDNLFDYFNEIKLSPQSFEKEAEAHGLLDIIQDAGENIDSQKVLIKNPFFNLALYSIITKKKQGINDDEAELIKEIENDNQLNEYYKELYIVEANLSNENEAVWNLLEENKHRNKSHLLTDKIDILVVSNLPIRGTQNFKAYFLFLKKK